MSGPDAMCTCGPGKHDDFAHMRWCPQFATMSTPEPRSTPGPSTGTPEPSQPASEAYSGEVARLEGVIRLMLDSGDITPAGARFLRTVMADR